MKRRLHLIWDAVKCGDYEFIIYENGPCGAEGEEKARYPQGLRGTIDILILSGSAERFKALWYASKVDRRHNSLSRATVGNLSAFCAATLRAPLPPC